MSLLSIAMATTNSSASTKPLPSESKSLQRKTKISSSTLLNILRSDALSSILRVLAMLALFGASPVASASALLPPTGFGASASTLRYSSQSIFDACRLLWVMLRVSPRFLQSSGLMTGPGSDFSLLSCRAAPLDCALPMASLPLCRDGAPDDGSVGEIGAGNPWRGCLRSKREGDRG